MMKEPARPMANSNAGGSHVEFMKYFGELQASRRSSSRRRKGAHPAIGPQVAGNRSEIVAIAASLPADWLSRYARLEHVCPPSHRPSARRHLSSAVYHVG